MLRNTKHKRVRFFSKEDMTCAKYLTMAEPILREFDASKYIDVNDIIELYQVKLLIDCDITLVNWSTGDINEFKNTTKEIWAHICLFWIKINDNNIINLLDNLEFDFQKDFWRLSEDLKVYKNISEDVFSQILRRPDVWIREILHQKNLTTHFDQPIKTFLLGYEKTAELLLSQYEESHSFGHANIYFPKSLRKEDIENLILNYLESEMPNLNYVRLIIKCKELKLSARTKLKAKEVEKILIDKLFDEQNCIKFGIEVSYPDSQVEPVKTRWDENIFKASYSYEWIKNNLDYMTLFHNFYLLFKYTDYFGRIELVSKEQEMDSFERIFMHSKNDYLYGSVFNRKNHLSLIQIISYAKVLENNNIDIETIISFFFTDYLYKEFGIAGYNINIPSKNSTWLEKVRMIAPEFEFILKQYKVFVEDGLINQSLLQIGSEPCHFKEIPSLMNKKYAYGTGEKFDRLKYLFFSNQSPLKYVEAIEKKYDNLYMLLENENVLFDIFENFQKPGIELLIQDGYLIIDDEGYVRICKPIDLIIIGDLFKNEVISYWRLPSTYREVVDEMALCEMVFFEDTLFSIPEQKYFSYYLNKSVFTNGLDLRNKYVHGSNGDSEEEHRSSYFIFLELIILAMLKIEEDLIIDSFIKENSL